jgi:TonB family protein
MTRVNRVGLFLFLSLCLGAALPAQTSTPESKSETTPQQSPDRQPRVVVLQGQVRLSRSVSQGLVGKKVEPDYPDEAREKHIQGEVVLHIIVSRDGDVTHVDLVSGPPMLEAAATNAVRQWKYQPYLLNGHPMQVDTEAVVNFTLDSSNSASDDAPPAAATDVRADTLGVLASERVRVSQAVSNGLVVRRVYPHYPPEARKGHIQGAVALHAIISKAGDIAKLELVSGDPLLVPAAMEAVKQWKYKPYLLNGKAVEVDTQITVNFTLSN